MERPHLRRFEAEQVDSGGFVQDFHGPPSLVASIWVTHWLSRRMRRYRKTGWERSKRCAKGRDLVLECDNNLFLYNGLKGYLRFGQAVMRSRIPDDIGGNTA